MAYNYKDHLFIFSSGRVAAINKTNGEVIWETKLKQYLKYINMSFGNLLHEEDKLFVGAGGYLVCLSAKDGSFIWKNELKGWGYNFVSMGSNASITAAAVAHQQALAAAT